MKKPLFSRPKAWIDNLPISIKIILMSSVVIGLFYLFLLIIFPFVLSGSLADYWNEHSSNHTNSQDEQTGFPIRQFVLLPNGKTVPQKEQNNFTQTQLQEILTKAAAQTKSSQLYEYAQDEIIYRCMINIVSDYEPPIYQITVIKKADENKFIFSMLFQFMYLTGIALILSLVLFLLFTRRLTRPLGQISKQVQLLANHEWEQALEIKGRGNITKLADSLEIMRKQLSAQEELQQDMMQNISHELKTPVMIIRSYVEAIQDGVFPKEDLGGSLKVIEQEGIRLEKLIKQLLCLTRLDYMFTQKTASQELDLKQFITNIINIMKVTRLDIDFSLQLTPLKIKGDPEKWQVLIENVLDNHLRYAQSSVKIALGRENNTLILTFWNDGSQLDKPIYSKDLQPFKKGYKGQNGLGLTIVYRIVSSYQGDICLFNEQGGVCTRISLDLTKLK